MGQEPDGQGGRLLYQIINFDVGGTQLNPLADYDAAVAVTQFTVRF